MNARHGKRPQAATIKAVVTHLEQVGLSVYGPWTNLATGEQGPGCMDFDAEQVLKYRKLKDADKLHVVKEKWE